MEEKVDKKEVKAKKPKRKKEVPEALKALREILGVRRANKIWRSVLESEEYKRMVEEAKREYEEKVKRIQAELLGKRLQEIFAPLGLEVKFPGLERIVERPAEAEVELAREEEEVSRKAEEVPPVGVEELEAILEETDEFRPKAEVRAEAGEGATEGFSAEVRIGERIDMEKAKEAFRALGKEFEEVEGGIRGKIEARRWTAVITLMQDATLHVEVLPSEAIRDPRALLQRATEGLLQRLLQLGAIEGLREDVLIREKADAKIRVKKEGFRMG